MIDWFLVPPQMIWSLSFQDCDVFEMKTALRKDMGSKYKKFGIRFQAFCLIRERVFSWSLKQQRLIWLHGCILHVFMHKILSIFSLSIGKRQLNQSGSTAVWTKVPCYMYIVPNFCPVLTPFFNFLPPSMLLEYSVSWCTTTPLYHFCWGLLQVEHQIRIPQISKNLPKYIQSDGGPFYSYSTVTGRSKVPIQHQDAHLH